MKIEPFIEKKEEKKEDNVMANQQQKDELRPVEGGGMKKRIHPKVI